MLATVPSAVLHGVSGHPVAVEVHLSQGFPGFTIVGLPDASCRESRDRVRAALLSSGFLWPQSRITVNLAPADLPKEGGRFDLPIALGILAASGQLPSGQLARHEFMGELALDGATRTTKGALSMAIAAAEQTGLRGIVVPELNAAEAAVVDTLEIIPVASLAQAVGFFAGTLEIEPTPPRLDQWFEEFATYDEDYADVRGQAARPVSGRAWPIAVRPQREAIISGASTSSTAAARAWRAVAISTT